MIYNEEYKIKFYKDPQNGQEPVADYICGLEEKERNKVNKYLEFLRLNRGCLDEPYSRHLQGKIRELRVDFVNNYHRIIYFTYFDKTIILLHAFLKKSQKTPNKEKSIAYNRYLKIINKN
jgi:phage-related protein